jgi:hypothetical protein
MTIIWDRECRHQMVTALLDCDCVKHKEARDNVVNDLLPQVQHNITRDNSSNVDVMSILKTCLDYAEGLADLLQAIKFYEQDSFAYQRVKQIYIRSSLNPM